nr:hypothetical protein [Tanacetum cinerariifolium]
MPKVLSLAWETILEIELVFEDKHCQPEDILELFRILYNDVQNIHEELEVDDDDEGCTVAITPILLTEEPDNSLSMGDEHLDTISATKSDEFIKSSVESLVPIPSESEGIPDNMCDVPFHDNSPPLDITKDQFEDFSDSKDDSTSNDDDSFSIDNIEYVEASPSNSELVSLEVMEIVILEVGRIDDDILLTIKDDILREKLLNVNLLIANIEALNDNPTPSSDFMTKSSSTSLNSLLEETKTFDNSLPELETFCFDLEEINSGSTTTHSDISLPKYEAFHDDHVKEISNGSTTTHSDSSLYDSFNFDLSINPSPPPIGVTFMSSPTNSLTSYFHRIESDTENVYDDPFDSKGEKIKESKLLIDELDLPYDFLLPSEYDSILYEDFSKVDALPSTNNEDKKLAISHASLMLEDFDPPFYELPLSKEVPSSSMEKLGQAK